MIQERTLLTHICKVNFVLYFNDLNHLYFNTSFIDHPCKELDKCKTIKHSFVVMKIDKYCSIKKYEI